ncbi:MAG: hypothetical protein AAF950_16080 [Pseudomonadota bacterium]
MNILGIIEIERKTDLLAFAAFMISVMTAFYQLGVYLSGPKAKLLAPEGVTIAQFENRPGQQYVSVIAPISVVNESNASEPLLVTKQTALLKIGAQTKLLSWHDWIDAPIGAEGISFLTSEAVHPFVIDTKKISSGLIRFTPQRDPCNKSAKCDPNDPFITFEDFRGMVLQALGNGFEQFETVVSVEFDNHETVTKVCSAPLHPIHLKLLRDIGYFMELCE